MDDVLGVMRPLTHEERLKARDRAAHNLAGQKPERKAFQHHTQSKYPPMVEGIILVLVAIVMLAAFAISTPRLYIAGYIAALASNADHLTAVIAGVAFFMLAETAQIVFSLAIAVVNTGRHTSAILWAGVALSTIIALVGNVSVAMPPRNLADAYFVVKWLDALAPPLLVLGVAYVLKDRILQAVQLRFANETAFQDAVHAWQELQRKPEAHKDWTHYYMQSLRDTILAANARGRARDVRKELSTQDWIVLLHREYNADAMLAELQVAVQEKRISQGARIASAPRRKHAYAMQRSGASGNPATDELADAVVENADETFTGMCPYCDYRTDAKPTERAAKNALAAHGRACKGKPEQANAVLVASNGHSNGAH